MDATKPFGSPDADNAAQLVRAQLQQFRAARARSPANLPPINEAELGVVAAAIVHEAPAPARCKPVGAKSDCVRRIEEMQRKREARRRRANEQKAQRADAVKEAEGCGGIESVDFLQLIKAWRAEHAAPSGPAPAQWGERGVWDEARGGGGSRIRVCVRKRPMLRAEALRHDFDVVSAERDALTVHEPRTRVDQSKGVEHHRFGFDAVFTEADGNGAVHAAALAPLLPHVLAGGAATVFAFGQTGSGKTCTMAGHGDPGRADGNALGLYGLAAEDLVAAAQRAGLLVGVAFFEVYRGQILDLLNGRARLDMLEDRAGRVQLPGLVEAPVKAAAELLELVRRGEAQRATGATSANETSSRSHAVLQLTLRAGPGTAGAPGGGGGGRLCLVDLAGSERAADASSKDRLTRLEGAEINKSLLCLKECIRALDGGSSHTPFRGSKLTQVLRDSFVGAARTAMIATISPGSSAADDTLNTLRVSAR